MKAVCLFHLNELNMLTDLSIEWHQNLTKIRPQEVPEGTKHSFLFSRDAATTADFYMVKHTMPHTLSS